MHKDDIRLFLQRSTNFYEAAKDRFKQKDWDLTCFFAEQSVQLILKSKILEFSGEMPKTHSIRGLLALLNKIIENEKIKFKREELVFLESSYLNARYFNFTYEKEDAKTALSLAKSIRGVVNSVKFND